MFHAHAAWVLSYSTVQAIEKHLKDQSYDDKLVPIWVNYICEDIVAGLADLGKPFKYIGMLYVCSKLAPSNLYVSPSAAQFEHLQLFLAHLLVQLTV